MKIKKLITSTALMACLSFTAATASAADVAVKITPDMAHAMVMHNGKQAHIMRNQDQKNKVNPAFAKTSRKCPPFCIKPMELGHGVETLGELEVIHYAVKMSHGDDSIILVDNRTPDWHARGSIPGAINIPFTKMSRAKGADALTIAETLETLGAKETGKGWDFSNAKTAVFFCNGMWCGQSPAGIAGLLAEGYPGDKIKWYRGGMQSWEILGLTTVK
ncbi:MAG: rhodanese-like domain-containing protein [Gammaproteobacteria bacterium]|nr:rhodanese-like domain-containing protein [Gammaproteobacteria bacterium]MCW8841681.1 rhodanese-like domain-containing protein [Gammaproteobacteria bacterium]MCW8958516.1 rhodanese-like domain-containing protein [Gammaproteobacteria bacterium]MCW8973653.1 rhodanese-like domain-containing protein [Gammaproteobacteria bacterium]MCW8991681.1 rhodanese-like domain-containing protein [Gammaproteobacteria bacterium]